MGRALLAVFGWALATPLGCAVAPLSEDRSLAAEATAIRKPVQLTFASRFDRAGEAYFSPDGEWIIFQAVEAQADGSKPSEHYAMFVAPLIHNASGAVVSLGDATRISPLGSANTCGFFHPREPGRVIFGSTLAPPAQRESPGYQRDTGRYAWAFPHEMEIVATTLDARGTRAQPLTPLWRRPGYDAEGAYSPDGRFIVHTRVDPETSDADIWAWDARTRSATLLVGAAGYDGGPFFSPDGRRICYRSDRVGDNLLQLFVAELRFDPSTGAITGIERERQITDNQHVNWAPWWHPSGAFLVYASSAVGHDNYEVFAIEVPPAGAADEAPATLARRRITFSPGFDGLPVVSPDGRLLMWTSQRSKATSDSGSSQLWVAEIVDLDPGAPAGQSE